jgi:hypothetical protein
MWGGVLGGRSAKKSTKEPVATPERKASVPTTKSTPRVSQTHVNVLSVWSIYRRWFGAAYSAHPRLAQARISVCDRAFTILSGDERPPSMLDSEV